MHDHKGYHAEDITFLGQLQELTILIGKQFDVFPYLKPRRLFVFYYYISRY